MVNESDSYITLCPLSFIHKITYWQKPFFNDVSEKENRGENGGSLIFTPLLSFILIT